LRYCEATIGWESDDDLGDRGGGDEGDEDDLENGLTSMLLRLLTRGEDDGEGDPLPFPLVPADAGGGLAVPLPPLLRRADDANRAVRPALPESRAASPEQCRPTTVRRSPEDVSGEVVDDDVEGGGGVAGAGEGELRLRRGDEVGSEGDETEEPAALLGRAAKPVWKEP
jgi:hypothetical protein